jgi:1,4-alpha-glucan branching enzyme
VSSAARPTSPLVPPQSLLDGGAPAAARATVQAPADPSLRQPPAGPDAIGRPPGELDLHLFGEGTHRRLWEMLGAHLAPGGGATFAVWAPNARNVRVLGDWSGWATGERDATPLTPQGSSGIWWGIEPRARAGHRYKFEVHGADGETTLRADPLATAAEVPPGTASVLFDPGYVWSSDSSASPALATAGSDDPWRLARAARNGGRLSVYEAHLGSWRRHPDGRPHDARELAEPLADWAVSLGFTHLELMPVATHPFGGSWGYQVSGYYAPDARLGSPDDLRHLIDVCHDRGLGVILDWVPAHFPKDRFALARFDGTALYEHADPRRGEHPDWGTLVFNHGRNEVRNFLVANALYWLEEFRVDGLRVDAVASMLYLDYSRDAGQWVPNVHGGREDLEAIGFVRELNAVAAQEHPGAMIIAEESTSWPGVTAPPEWGGLGFSRKWNLGWMHDTLSYFAHDSVHRAHHHGELTFPMVYARHERWMLPLSHDEVVHGKGSLLHKMPGEGDQRFANLRALLAWQWCHPGRQLLFMGSELAQEREWSHDRELDWWLLEEPAHEGIRRLVADLNALQARYPALWSGDDDLDGHVGWLDAHDHQHSVFSLWRTVPEWWDAEGVDPSAPSERGVVVVVANLTPVARHGYRLGVPELGEWRVVLDSDADHYGGTGTIVTDAPDGVLVADADTPWQHQPGSLLVTLPPLSVLVLARG